MFCFPTFDLAKCKVLHYGIFSENIVHWYWGSYGWMCMLCRSTLLHRNTYSKSYIAGIFLYDSPCSSYSCYCYSETGSPTEHEARWAGETGQQIPGIHLSPPSLPTVLVWRVCGTTSGFHQSFGDPKPGSRVRTISTLYTEESVLTVLLLNFLTKRDVKILISD